MNQLFVPNAENCNSRKLHGMDISLYGLRNEIDSPDFWMVTATKNNHYPIQPRYRINDAGGLIDAKTDFNQDGMFDLLSVPNPKELGFSEEATQALNERCVDAMPLPINTIGDRVGKWRASKGGFEEKVFFKTKTLKH